MHILLQEIKTNMANPPVILLIAMSLFSTTLSERKLTKKEKSMSEAAKHALDTVIADLCAEEVDPNVADIQNNGYTPLHLAALNRNVEALITLARCSANLNAKDFDGNTPLHIAVINDNPWSAYSLLMLGANPNKTNNEGKTAMDLLTIEQNEKYGFTFKPERLVWMNEVRPFSDKEQNILRLVKKGRHINLADSCMRGIDIRVKNADNNHFTFLHYAVSTQVNIRQIIQTLIRCGADINARDADGNTPLHLAVSGKYSGAKKVLLLYGANPFIANRAGITVYQMMKESSPDGIDDRLRWYMNRMPV